MLKLLKEHPYAISFGVLSFFFGGIGQTYLLAFYNPYFLKKMHLSPSQLGFLYSFATLCAAATLPMIGQMIDKKSASFNSFILGLILALGLLVLGLSNWWPSLLVGFFVVRAVGQSGINLIGSTFISVHFGRERGKTLALAQMGRPLSEAILPLIVSFSLAALGGFGSFAILALLVVFAFIPLSFLLYKKTATKGEAFYDENKAFGPLSTRRDWTVKQAYSEKRIYLLIISNIFVPFYMTGMFFFHSTILEDLNLSIDLWAYFFSTYAISQVFHSLLSGQLIDRFSAVRIYPFIPIPFVLGISLLVYSATAWGVMAFLIGAGAAVGLYTNTKNAFLAEVYGLKGLAAIKGMDSTWSVISTAISPVLFPFLRQWLGGEAFQWVLIVIPVVACLFFIWTYKTYRPQTKA